MANWWDEAQPAAPQSQAQVNWWDAAPAQPQVQQSDAQQPEAWNPALGLSRDVVNGIPVVGPLYTGAMDQVTSNVASWFTGEDPQSIRDRVHGKQDQYEAENPVLSTIGQVAGGTVAMAPLGATAAGSKARGLTGPLWQRLVAGGLSGSTIGAGDAAARGGDLTDIAIGAGTGGIFGLAGGVVAPYITAGLTKAGDIGRKALGISARPGNVPISRPASEIITRALDADGTLGTQAGLNMSQAGPRAMMADAGPNAMSLLDTAIQRSGPGSRMAIDAIDARASGANDDIIEALNAGLGKPEGVYTTGNALRTNTAASRGNAYDAAYAAPIDYSSDAGRAIENLMPRIPGNVIGIAKRMMQAEGVQSQQMFAQVADDGAVTFTRMPDVRELDYITRALNQAASNGEGQGALGGITDIGRIYRNLARDIRGATKDAVPDYATALETAATPIQQREALEFGATILRPNVARDEAADIISGLTGPQRQYAKQGVRSQIDEALANVRAVVSDPNLDAREAKKALGELSSRAAREKIRLLIGDDTVADAMFARLDEATKSLELRANVASNSRTFARTSTDQTVQSYINDGAVNQALDGKPINAMQSIIQSLTGRDAKGKTEIADRVYSEIAQLLTQDPDAGMDLISGLAARKNLAGRPNILGLSGGISPTTQSIINMLSGGVAQ